MDFLDSLDSEQRDAVTHDGGPLLIVAGPGTGKTRTLTARIAWLVQGRGVDPAHIMAVTFSNRAAKEMRERLEAIVPLAESARVKNVGTFHAICWQILRRELGAEWSICSEEAQLAIVRQVLRDVDSDPSIVGRRNIAEKVTGAISRLKGSLADVASGDLQTDVAKTELIPAIGRAYQAALEDNKLLDFDDLILRTVRLFEKSPDSLAHYRRRFRHIAVDEFQDTNAAQFRLIELLASGEGSRHTPCAVHGTRSVPTTYDYRSLTVIGDPDQAIYSFRGASSQHFIDFETSFPGACVVRLTRCYRSSPMILNAACAIIRRNPGRMGHRLESHAAPGPTVQVHRAESEEDEAKSVVGEIRRLMGGLDRQDFDTRAVIGQEPDDQLSFADFAVLYRLHAVGAAMVEEFTRSGIPYQQIGGPLLREQAETRRLIEALRFLANPEDCLSRDRIGSNSSSGLLASGVAQWQTDFTAQSPARTVLERLASRLGQHSDQDGPSAWERLLAQATARDESLGEFLRRLDIERYEDLHDPRADKVTLMTLHAAKGLEFGVVFLVGCEAGVLPYLRGDPSLPARRHSEAPIPLPADGATGQGVCEAIEEERRLFYVGMTRARRRLFITGPASRFLFGERTTNEPSPFLAEIPSALVGPASESTPHDSRRTRRRGARQRKLFQA